ncbi:MAG TPA: TasA family protein [Frankiaceae bacterium]|nr:TasA family protein [Frankiaceae bacterium]
MGKHSGRPAGMRPGTKILASGVVVTSAAAVIGGGVLAAWNTTGNVTTGTYSAATVSSSFASSGTPVFSAAISNMVPGDSATRYADLRNTGSVSLAFSLDTAGTGTLSDALDLVVYKCATAYEDGVCGEDGDGTQVTSGSSTDQDDLSLGTVASNGYVYLKMVATLPANADKATYAGTSGTITLTETGTTLAGTAR